MALFPLLVAFIVLVVIARERLSPSALDATAGRDVYSQLYSQSDSDYWKNSGSLQAQTPLDYETGAKQGTTEVLLDIESYEDADYGFTVAIPTGWQKIIAAETDESFSQLEPGYAVGFESPHQGEEDQFADYLLIEVLPGRDSGLFESDGKNRRRISINGQSAWMDRLEVKGERGGLTEVDLTIFQAEISGLGYTVGLYAIGEPSRAKLMSEAFEVIVRTFRLSVSPFPIS
ncbi:MAG: hypothetical protein AB8B79_01390 [Granulosicoccus sp.]